MPECRAASLARPATPCSAPETGDRVRPAADKKVGKRRLQPLPTRDKVTNRRFHREVKLFCAVRAVGLTLLAKLTQYVLTYAISYCMGLNHSEQLLPTTPVQTFRIL